MMFDVAYCSHSAVIAKSFMEVSSNLAKLTGLTTQAGIHAFAQQTRPAALLCCVVVLLFSIKDMHVPYMKSRLQAMFDQIVD